MIFQRLFCWAGLVLFVPLASAGAERPVLDVDLSASRVRPEGCAQFIGAGDSRHLRFDVQSPAPGADVSLVFGRPVSLAGKDRLVLEGRGEESTGLAVHIARLVLLAANGRAGANARLRGYIARSTDGGGHWELVKTGIEPQCVLIDPF